MLTIDAPHLAFLAEHDRGLLATVAPNGTPQNKPVGYRFDPGTGVVEIAGIEMERSAKFRNVAEHPEVAFTVEDQPDPSAGAGGVRFLELRGPAEQLELERPPIEHTTRWVLRIRPRRLVSWNVAAAGGPVSGDLMDGDGDRERERPRIGLAGPADDHARAAVDRFVAELQAGLDARDATRYNASFAADVAWGSPFGATLEGYDRLHAIHAKMLTGDTVHARSRYELVRARTLAPGVVLAQVRRRAVDAEGRSLASPAGAERFSEMALYVLVRRAGRWWLAAGQNTVVADDRGVRTGVDA